MRNKKRIMVVITSLCFCLTFMINSFEVGASSINYVFQVPYAEPSTSDTQGYVNIFGTRSNGTKYLQTWFWSVQPYHADLSNTDSQLTHARMNINVDYSNKKIKFEPIISDTSEGGVYTLFMYDLAGNLVVYDSASFVGSKSITYSQLAYGGFTIDCVVPYGNIGRFSASSNPKDDFTVLYGADALEYEKMNDLITLIGQLQGNLSNIQTNTNKANLHLQKGVTSLQNLEAHAISLIEEAERTNDNLLEIDSRLTQIYNQLLLKSDADSDKLQNFESDSDSQSNQLNDMNNQLAVNKPSSDSVAGDVDTNIDYDAIGVFGAVLSPFMGNQMIVKMMLIALSICLVSYIFFGKRG